MKQNYTSTVPTSAALSMYLVRKSPSRYVVHMSPGYTVIYHTIYIRIRNNKEITALNETGDFWNYRE